MTRRSGLRAAGIAAAFFAVSFLASPPATGAPPDRPGPTAHTTRVTEHWTPERRATAIPRDLVLDEDGRAYLRLPNGRLQPYGRPVAFQEESTPVPMAKPGGGGGGGDGVPPVVADMNPGAGGEIGTSYTFSAKVTDASDLRSVKFSVRKGTAKAQSFTATDADGDDIWTARLSSFTDGDWSWQVVAKDRSGLTTTTGAVAFRVNSALGGGVVTNAEWTTPGALQTATGRIYFYMPDSPALTRWVGYVCSGTVVTDGVSGRSVIQTAAHCVYDDANKAFARNVMFIPDQDRTTSGYTDRDCSNDPLGCWVPSFGVVDDDWSTRTFPDNIPWDYGYYVVSDAGAHQGTATGSDALDVAAGAAGISFTAPQVGLYTRALGYSYSDDPKLMYCAEDMATSGTDNWWLGSCDLSGGSSGGPWIQDMANGTGDVMSVNSWGYTNWPGMAGPKLSGTSAQCVFTTAVGGTTGSDPYGIVVPCD